MQKEYKVLDHGYVMYQGHLGTEEDIIRAARMSTQKDFLGWGHSEKCAIQNGGFCSCKGGDEKLLEYLYKNHHLTPFEMLELRVQVKLPIFVVREWMRHRTQSLHGIDLDMMSFNEMSARYIQMPNEHYVPELRMQDTKNKQGSILNMCDRNDIRNTIKVEQDTIYENYEAMLSEGIAKEVARINTPVSRYTVMWAKANLRNWLQFLQLRMAPNAQWEIRQYANAVAEIVKSLWPRMYGLFEEYTLNSKQLSASDVKIIREFFDEYPEGVVLKEKLGW